MDHSVQIRWLGVAGIEIVTGGQTLLVDPFFTRPPFWRAWVGRVAPDRALSLKLVQQADAILVSHAHYDHLLDVPDLALATGATVYGSANTCRLLAACGLPPGQVHEIEVGASFSPGGFGVEALTSRHSRLPGFGSGALRADLKPPLRLRDYRMDICLAFLIQADGLRIFDCGAGRPDLPAPAADVLICGPGKDAAFYQGLLASVQPRLVIPVHWDDFFRPLNRPLRPMLTPPEWRFPPVRRMDLQKFQEMVAQVSPGTRALIPEVFRPYEIGSLS